MIEKSDIITCESYKSLADYIYRPNGDVPSGLVHVNFEEIPAFFSAIEPYPERRYVVISSCSDFGLAYQAHNPVWADMPKWARIMATPEQKYNNVMISARCDVQRCRLEDKYSVKCYCYTAYTFPEIPPQIAHWFMTNSWIHPIEDSRITIIPFGVAPGGKDSIFKIAEATANIEKKAKLYINWVNYTCERVEVKENYRALRSPDITIIDEAKPYEDYLTDLAYHEIILSPEGNGIDCYRMLEALYMGSMPVVQINPVTMALAELPMAIVYTLYGLNVHSLSHVFSQIKNQVRPLDKIKLSYWASQFQKYKGLVI